MLLIALLIVCIDFRNTFVRVCWFSVRMLNRLFKSRARRFSFVRTGGPLSRGNAFNTVADKMVRRGPGRGRTGYLNKRLYPRFAMSGFVRNTEKKYVDTSWGPSAWAQWAVFVNSTGVAQVQGTKFLSRGKVQRPNGDFPDTSTNNLISMVGTGATAVSRIGNKVRARYLDVGITMEAAKSPYSMGGEIENQQTPTDPSPEYMKTVWRFVLVKDLQANNPTGVVEWGEVFGSTDASTGAEGMDFASADKLEVNNMGRFIILKDFRCVLDADDPMKILNFKLWMNEEIRYNAATANGVTDKGFYLLAAQDVLGTANVINSTVIPGTYRASVRFCFTD